MHQVIRPDLYSFQSRARKARKQVFSSRLLLIVSLLNDIHIVGTLFGSINQICHCGNYAKYYSLVLQWHKVYGQYSITVLSY